MDLGAHSQDQERLATIVCTGRRSAANALAQVLAGQFSVADPINTSASSLLVSTFYTLGDDARSIFREALGDILERPPAKSLELGELSAALYTAWEIDLFRRRPGQSKTALMSLLELAMDAHNEETVSLVLKYLSSSRLVTRVDEWKAIHSRYGPQNLLSCFMGMATVSLSQTVLWLADTPQGPEFQLVLDYGLPALCSTDEGVDRVRSALQRVQPDIRHDLFLSLSRAYGLAIGIEEEALGQWQDYLADGQGGHLVDSGDREYSDMDAEFASLAQEWDLAAEPSGIPAEIVDLFDRNVA
jgi:hypothetical protein